MRLGQPERRSHDYLRTEQPRYSPHAVTDSYATHKTKIVCI